MLGTVLEWGSREREEAESGESWTFTVMLSSLCSQKSLLVLTKTRSESECGHYIPRGDNCKEFSNLSLVHPALDSSKHFLYIELLA